MDKEYWVILLTIDAVLKIIDNVPLDVRLGVDRALTLRNTELGKNFPGYDYLVGFETEGVRDEYEKIIEGLGLSDQCQFTRVNLPVRKDHKIDRSDV